MTPEALLSAFDHPPALGRAACQARNRLLGSRIRLRPCASHSPPAVAARWRDDALESFAAWPQPQELHEGDAWVVQVDPTPHARRLYATWLHDVAARALAWTISPISIEPAGLHRLWCIAAARLSLPAAVRVEARHDLIGIRLAQISLGFGADTLAGPLAAERKLPLAGLPRPTETSRVALQTLVRQTGLELDDHTGSARERS